MHRTKHWLENRVGPSMSQEQLLLPKVFACWLLEVMLVCVCVCVCGADFKRVAEITFGES